MTKYPQSGSDKRLFFQENKPILLGKPWFFTDKSFFNREETCFIKDHTCFFLKETCFLRELTWFMRKNPVLSMKRTCFIRRGIEWSLLAFASMRAVRLFLRARAVINFLMRAANTLEITNGEQRALCKFSASWDFSTRQAAPFLTVHMLCTYAFFSCKDKAKGDKEALLAGWNLSFIIKTLFYAK